MVMDTIIYTRRPVHIITYSSFIVYQVKYVTLYISVTVVLLPNDCYARLSLAKNFKTVHSNDMKAKK